MVNAQEYLDQNYPCYCDKYEKKYSWLELIHQESCPRKTKELNLRNLNLEGDLDLEGFDISYPNYLKVYLTGNPRLGKIKNKPYRTALVYQNPQEFFNKNYPNKEKVERIGLSDLDFEQPSEFELTLDNYPSLKEINGSYISNLTKLTISNCPRLEAVNISKFKDNQELILNNLPNLKEIDCSSNDITDLIIADCPNLKTINVFFSYTKTSKFIININNCPNVSELNFHESKISGFIADKGLFNISKIDFFN